MAGLAYSNGAYDVSNGIATVVGSMARPGSSHDPALFPEFADVPGIEHLVSLKEAVLRFKKRKAVSIPASMLSCVVSATELAPLSWYGRRVSRLSIIWAPACSTGRQGKTNGAPMV